MSKCPFWSSKRIKVECNSECPMLNASDSDSDTDDKCIFCECLSDNDINIDLQGLIKEEYSFMNVAAY